MDDGDSGQQSLKKALKSTEKNILKASSELKDIVMESGNMAESLYERVDTGYKELEVRVTNCQHGMGTMPSTNEQIISKFSYRIFFTYFSYRIIAYVQ